ncbi:MAG: DUF1552 domain-containing protein [Planctomycetota bacterium]|jgi:hypothetical protein
MAGKSWRLDRRTFLRGSGGIALGLPMLESMSHAAKAGAAEAPRRFCGMYFPYGASSPSEDHADREWGWLPVREGDGFRYTKVLEPLTGLRDKITVMGGLSHPKGRDIGGHDTADIFLTGASFMGANFKNDISLDQAAAMAIGERTRFPSLTLSTDGGIGEPTRSSTLAFSASGQPIPSLSEPRQIFARLFGADAGSVEQARKRLANSGSMLDILLEHSKSMRGRLGKQDQRKYDEYLNSVREIEQGVERSERWLDIPKPEVDEGSLDLSATPDGPREYIGVMYDLMFLAFQTDTTRLATYQLGSMNGATSIAGAFPSAVGLGASLHKLAHGAGKKGGFVAQGKWDRFQAEQLARFLNRLATTEEGDGTLLDRTMVLFGSSNSRTHNNNNYPLLLAGGQGLGLKGNQYLTYGEDTPMSNLLATVLNRITPAAESFADSTGELTELLA